MYFPPSFILIVDDEIEFGMFQKYLLESRGMNVSVATSGREALQFGVLLTAVGAVAIVDMMMPGMDGLTTIHPLQQEYPSLRYVASSGHPETAFRARLNELGVRHFLAKPYTTDRLMETIHNVLAGVDPRPEPPRKGPPVRRSAQVPQPS